MSVVLGGGGGGGGGGHHTRQPVLNFSNVFNSLLRTVDKFLGVLCGES